MRATNLVPGRFAAVALSTLALVVGLAACSDDTTGPTGEVLKPITPSTGSPTAKLNATRAIDQVNALHDYAKRLSGVSGRMVSLGSYTQQQPGVLLGIYRPDGVKVDTAWVYGGLYDPSGSGANGVLITDDYSTPNGAPRYTRTLTASEIDDQGEATGATLVVQKSYASRADMDFGDNFDGVVPPGQNELQTTITTVGGNAAGEVVGRSQTSLGNESFRFTSPLITEDYRTGLKTVRKGGFFSTAGYISTITSRLADAVITRKQRAIGTLDGLITQETPQGITPGLISFQTGQYDRSIVRKFVPYTGTTGTVAIPGTIVGLEKDFE